jgi:hypothetical protein
MGESESLVSGNSLPLSQQDWLIEFLVHTAGAAKDGLLPFGVTLSVGGFLVSGMVIRAARYFDLLGRLVGSALEDGGADDDTVKWTKEALT